MIPSVRSAHSPSYIPGALHLHDTHAVERSSTFSKARSSHSRHYPYDHHEHAQEPQASIHDDDGDTDWIVENEYIDLGAPNPQLTPPTPREPHSGRPLPERRGSEDIEFGNRLPTWRTSRRGKPWEVNMKLPRRLSRGKTLLMKTLRRTGGHGVVGVVRSPLGSLVGGSPGSGHGHGRKSRTGTPTKSFEIDFRDPREPPESIRMQYAELAPSDGSSSSREKERATKVDGMLAVPDAENARRMQAQRERTASMASAVRPATINGARSRSRSLHSRRSAERLGGSAMAHDLSGTTAVDHDAHHDKSPSFSNSTSTSSSGPQVAQVYSRMHSLRHRNRAALAASGAAPVDASTQPDNAALIKAKKHEMKLANHQNQLVRAGAPVAKALHALAKLPWMASEEHPRGALIPQEEPRLTADFVPSRSGRGRDKVRGVLGGNPNATAADAIYQAMRAKERESGTVQTQSGESWYKPRRPRSMNHSVGTPKSRPRSIAGGMKHAYRAYRAASAGTDGRPLGYMYASPTMTTTSSAARPRHYNAVAAASEQGANAGQAYAEAIARSSQSQSMSKSISSGSSRPSIAAAASAYLIRSASSGANSGRLNQHQQRQGQSSQPQASYHYPHANGQTTYARPMPYGASPALPPIPPASSSTHSRSLSGHVRDGSQSHQQGVPRLPSVPSIPSVLSSSSGSAVSSATATLNRSRTYHSSNHDHAHNYSPSKPRSNYAGHGGYDNYAYGGYGYASHPGPVLSYSQSPAGSSEISSLGQAKGSRHEAASSGGHGFTSGSMYGHAGNAGRVQPPVRYAEYDYGRAHQQQYVPNAR